MKLMLVLSLVILAGCETTVRTVDKGKYERDGQTYRHLTTTVTIERDPVCVGSCAERP